MEEYNLNLSNPAYHCGGLMAVYAAIQRTAMPEVNTGIVERYYASAIQMPALAIGIPITIWRKWRISGWLTGTGRICRKYLSRWAGIYLQR